LKQLFVDRTLKAEEVKMKKFVFVALLVGMLCESPMVLAGARTDDPLGVAVSPQTLLLGTNQSGAVLVHTDIPLSSVATSTLDLNGIPASGAYADSLGNLVAAFNEMAVKSIVFPPAAELTLTGYYLSGEGFYGSDTVRVEVYRDR
jgi:hypothetical protein